MDETKNKINDLVYTEAKTNLSEQQEEKRIKKNEESVSSLWEYFKHSNLHIIGVPEGEEEEQDIENLFEKIMKEYFPYLMKEIETQVQEAQRVPNKLDPKRNTPRHIIIKLPNIKDKERILKAATERKELPTE